MSDLASTVQQAQSILSEVYSSVKNASLGTDKLKVQNAWLTRAKLHEDLLETQKLFACRDDVMRVLEDLRDNAMRLGSASISTRIDFGTMQITLSSARLMFVDSYLALTWSIYDRLSNVLGRLMGEERVVENSNPAQNPKLVGDLIAQAKGSFQGFGINELLPKLYGEQIYASYFLRNSFIHDGGMMNNVPILTGSCAVACFELSKGNADKMNCVVKQRFGGLGSGIFKDRDLIAQLRVLHDDLDKMFASLTEFVVGSFGRQVSLFCGRIGINSVNGVALGEVSE